MKIATVITAFNPTIRLAKSVENLKLRIDFIVIVNNGIRDNEVLSFIRRKYEEEFVEIIDLHDNTGVAHALNVGVERVRREKSFDYILTLDQDTVVTVEDIRGIVATASKYFTNFGILALTESSTSEDRLFSQVRSAITSGNIVRMDVFSYISYREDFFIDSIDADFNYKVIRAGYVIIRYNKMGMSHELGKTKNKVRFQPSFRLYYITRNSTVLLIERKTTFMQYTYHILSWFFRLILVGDGFNGITAILQGLLDGLTQKLGKNIKYIPTE